MAAMAPHSVIMVFWKKTRPHSPVEELWKDAGIRRLFLCK